MNIIEQRIWEYLDETCTEQERKLTEHLIETDPDYRVVYEEFKLFSLDISSAELEEPSMGFSRNVMEKIQLDPIPGSVKSLIDKRIIYGIAAFFLVTIAALLGIMFYQMDWAQPQPVGVYQYIMPRIDVSAYLSRSVINIFLFANIILGLYLLDGFLRKQMNTKK